MKVNHHAVAHLTHVHYVHRLHFEHFDKLVTVLTFLDLTDRIPTMIDKVFHVLYVPMKIAVLTLTHLH